MSPQEEADLEDALLTHQKEVVRLRAVVERQATRIEELEAALRDIAEERCPPGMEGDSERIRYWQQNSALAALREV